MKQFLTLSLAAAMLGSAVSVDAKVTLKRAMELKSEGKTITAPLKTRNTKALKTLHSAPVSGFHKLMAEKEAVKADRMKKVAGKVTAQGDNIYGYLGFSYNDDFPYGLYEFNADSQSLVWAEETGLPVANLSLSEGVLKGYVVDIFWGMLFGVAYVEYDFETGELLNLVEDELSTYSFMQSATLDPTTNTFYGYGVYDSEYGFLSAPADDPFNYSPIKQTEEEMCMSMCYNANTDAIYGVTLDYDFVMVDRNTGDLTKLASLDVPNGAEYLTGMVYDAVSNCYYWNINTYDDDSFLATIDGDSYALDIYETLKNSEEYMALFTTDNKVNPDQPKRPVPGEAKFLKASLLGTVSFTLPSEMGDGAPISGRIEYLAYLDGELYTTGRDVAGSVVEIPFAVSEEGMHVFGLAAVVDGVESSMASVRYYVGNDTPLAPADVTLSSNEVTWSPVGEVGTHGGYVDADKVVYDVYLNGTYLGETSETTYALAEGLVDPTADLATYRANVVAKCNGYESSDAASNVILEGKPFELPVFFEPTPEQFAISMIYDGNDDGETWVLTEDEEDGSYFINSGWNGSMQIDEWYFLPPVQIDDVTRFYSFSMDVACMSSYYTDEYVEVLVCDEPSPNGVVGTVIDEFMPEGVAFEKASGEFRVRQEGKYYIAIHATSDPDQYGVAAKNFSIEDRNITLESPASLDYIDLEAAKEGKLQATVSFAFPTKNLGGNDLPADAVLKAVVSCANSVEVSGKPGEEVSVVVDTFQGENTVTVAVSYGELNSPYATETVYTGVVAPVTVDDDSLTYEVTPDHLSMILNWAPVTEGVDGGYIIPENVVYDIYTLVQTVFGSDWGLYESGITETTYTYTPMEQKLAYVGIVARNEAGDNGYLVYRSAILGPAVDLPIEENFDDAMFFSDPWVIYTMENAPEATIEFVDTYNLSDDYADSNTISLVFRGPAGAVGQFGSPYFSTMGMSSVVFTMEVSGDFDLPKVTILAEGEGIELEKIGEIVQDEAGFKNVSVSLPAKFLNNPYVGLFIQYEFETGDEVLALESLSIGGTTGVSAISGESVKIAAGKNVIKVSGLNGQNVTVANVNGAVVAKAAKVNREASFQVEKGIYVVEAGDKKAKVVVK